jgi:glycosyltransferase involved in cell wall biosynthesis
MKEEFISVIIPGYNERDIIKDTIESVNKILVSTGKQYEILIVDDGSKDDTLKILKKLIKSGRNRHLRFISYKDGPSRRENLASSFKFLKGKYVVLLDMDLSMDPKYIKDMIYCLDGGYDIVCASRYVSGSRIKRNRGRFIISKLHNAFIQLLFRTKLKDNVCGFKAFKKDVILRLVEAAGVDKNRTRSVFWDTEILIYARHLGFSIKEIPIRWVEGKRSALNFKREVKMYPYIIKFWFSLINKKG